MEPTTKAKATKVNEEIINVDTEEYWRAHGPLSNSNPYINLSDLAPFHMHKRTQINAIDTLLNNKL